MNSDLLLTRQYLLLRNAARSPEGKVDPSAVPIGVSEDVRSLEHLNFIHIKGRDTCQVLDRGREWLSVCTIDDGQMHVFGEPVEDRCWTTLSSAMMKFVEFLTALRDSLNEFFTSEHHMPQRLHTLLCSAETVMRFPRFPSSYLPPTEYRDAAVLGCRAELLRLRNHIEMLEVRARDRNVLSDSLEKIGHLEWMLRIPSLAPSLTAPMPRLTDFVNVGVVERNKTGRATDEKFGILSAPNLFTPDYRDTLEGAFSRGRSFAVGFVDIDKFKDFNEEHDEVLVDRVILPQFMRAIEAYCHRRAYAYRQGGDEYLVLVHNADANEALAFFEGLQRHLATIDYPTQVTRKPTVSIGVHVVDAIHEVTEFEAKKRANEAKKKAKDAGRNRVHLWGADS